MGYSSGFLKHRIMVLNRTQAEMGDYGLDSSGAEWEECGCIWANVAGQKGMAAASVGAFDVYGKILVRCRYDSAMKVGLFGRSRIRHQGTTYSVLPETVQPDEQDNTMQLWAQAIINDQ